MTTVRDFDAGNYQVVASNVFGSVTSAAAPVVIHFVNASNNTPSPPYAGWPSSANNIQDAIGAAQAGEIVLVTNGVYLAGGKSMDAIITNRVTVDKALLLQSVNGPEGTFIQGAWDLATTNGLGAVRCVWMTNNSVLSGFTIRGGATRAYAQQLNASMDGGGVYATTNSATLANCVLATNAAGDGGGGAYRVTLNSCSLVGNIAMGAGHGSGTGQGAGADRCNLRNCLLTANSAAGDGGGAYLCNATNCAFTGNRSIFYGAAAYSGTLLNCTAVNNTAGGYGSQSGAVANANLTNCIVWGNFVTNFASFTNYYNCTFSYCDTHPLPVGAGNIDIDPQLLSDNVHLSSTSPCRALGTNMPVGVDIDGQGWNNPPSIGCDEWAPAPVLITPVSVQVGYPARRLIFSAPVAGQNPLTFQWSRNSIPIGDDSHHTNSQSANLMVIDFGPEDAGSYQVIVTNSFGSVTSQMVKVVIHVVNPASTNSIAPYDTWPTAATSIQAAIDSALGGEIVLATNGVYTTGGRAMSAGLTNRVVLDKPLIVMSVNGYTSSIIEGMRDPIATNGPGAMRCAWLTNGAVLSGFTLRNGATLASSGNFGAPAETGGGAWGASASEG